MKNKEHKKKKIKSIAGNNTTSAGSPRTDIQTVPSVIGREINNEMNDPGECCIFFLLLLHIKHKHLIL